MRILLLLVAGLLALIGPASPAAAADRLDVLAAQLRERPLAIDTELSWFFGDAQKARLVRTLRASPVDFHVALVPTFEADESGGDAHRVVVALHRRLRRPGVYLVIDQYGYLSSRAYGVPRRVTLAYGLDGPPTDRRLRAAEVIGRVERLVAGVVAAPAGRTTEEDLLRPLRPYGQRFRSGDEETTADVALGAAVVGGLPRPGRRRRGAPARAPAERRGGTERRAPAPERAAMTRARTRLAVVLGLLVVAAAATTATAVAATLPKDIAAQLRRSPLFVDPALAEAVSPAQRRAVLGAIQAAPHPIWAMVVPLTAGDRYGGDPGRLLDVVHGRLGRDGVYVTVGERVLTTAAFGVDESDPDLNQAGTVANFESANYNEPQITKILRFVEVLRDPNLSARAARTEARLRALNGRSSLPPLRATAARTMAPAAAGCSPSSRGWLVLGGGALLHRRRRGRHARPAPDDEPLIPARVFRHAHTAQAGELRTQIEERLIAFAERADRAGAPSSDAAAERQQHALDTYAAARRVLAAEPPMADLVGALVLVEDGTRALAAAEALAAGRPVPAPVPLCFFDPRHPGSTKRVAWERGLSVPACAPCRAALRAGRPPEALLDDGAAWFETDSLWARTGFGLFDPDHGRAHRPWRASAAVVTSWGKSPAARRSGLESGRCTGSWCRVDRWWSRPSCWPSWRCSRRRSSRLPPRPPTPPRRLRPPMRSRC